MIIGIVLLIILIIVIAVIASKTKDVAEAVYDVVKGDGDDDDNQPQVISKIDPASTNSDPDPASTNSDPDPASIDLDPDSTIKGGE